MPCDVLLLPGLGCDEALFTALLPALDTAGHTRTLSASHARHATMEAMAAEIAEAVTASAAPPVLIGCSMGAMLALMTATQVQGRIAGLVLIGTSAQPDPPDVVQLRQWAANEFEAGRIDEVVVPNVPLALHEASARNLALVGAYLAMVRRAGGASLARQNRAVAARPDLRPLLPSIAVPTLVLCGDADRLTPPENGREIAGAMPQAEFHIIEGAGHLPTLEQPAAVRERLLPWLAQRRP